MKTVVVTRHRGLVEYLREQNIIPEGAKILSHVEDISEIKGKHVIGVLPMHLAAHTDKITEVPLVGIPTEKRGEELSIEDVRLYAKTPRTYEVQEVDPEAAKKREMMMGVMQ